MQYPAKRWHDMFSRTTDTESQKTKPLQIEFFEWLEGRNKLCAFLSRELAHELQNSGSYCGACSPWHRTEKHSILREDSVAASLLSTLWYHHEGKEYLEKVIAPLPRAIGASNLELNPKNIESKKEMFCDNRCQVKRNFEQMIKALREFLDSVYKSESIFPR